MNAELWVTLGPWEYDEAEGWKHCGRSAWLDDDGATCSKCQAFTSWDDEEGAGE
jgi:hypothetical protein